ncbi:hypothetical protein OTB20_20110 [Streptomyces sp. H27-H1]|uniref:hypothetical protein n=1 Tax=Streptomyces sp. H27-H1 TaxID=2996461 RepID=UPI00226FB7B6|nr:hypothetical protein [Streptomyces sp. H27-H1]MCY0928463.1 hypothetical protein [Streptomyces sp. H27-H1]
MSRPTYRRSSASLPVARIFPFRPAATARTGPRRPVPVNTEALRTTRAADPGPRPTARPPTGAAEAAAAGPAPRRPAAPPAVSHARNGTGRLGESTRRRVREVAPAPSATVPGAARATAAWASR